MRQDFDANDSSLYRYALTMRIPTNSLLRGSLWLATSSRSRSWAMMASSSNSDAICNNNNEQELQALWSTSYDGWINVPKHSPGVVYLRPAKDNEMERAASKLQHSIPSVVKECTGGIFALTAFNPMGQDRPHAENQAANERLAKDLEQLSTLHSWKAFGFAQDWREDGFVVAFGGDTGAKPVIDLAAKYQQGAIYEFVPIIDDDRIVGLRRKTIPVAMENVEADVVVIPCEKPSLANAELAS